MELPMDRDQAVRENLGSFWCPICKLLRDGDRLQIATRAGDQLHTVCREHIPDDHHEDAVVETEVPEHEEVGATNAHIGKLQPTGKVIKGQLSNEDGIVRTLVYEDLL